MNYLSSCLSGSQEVLCPLALRRIAPRNLASNGFQMSNLRKVACPVRRALSPFKCRFSPFGAPGFLVCHPGSSLMLKEYRLTYRGILVP